MGWRLAVEGEWPALRRLEPELASAEGLDPAYSDAQRLRIQWRIASDDPALHADAVEIASDLLRVSANPEDMILGAKAFAVANQSEGALQLLDALSRRRLNPRLVDAVIELIDSLPPEVDEARGRAIRNLLTRGREPAKGSVDDV